MPIDGLFRRAPRLSGGEAEIVMLRTTALLLLAYPILVLSVRDGMSVCLVVMLAVSISYLVRHSHKIAWQRGDTAFLVAMSSLLILTAANEVYHKTFKLSELDGPSRFLMGAPAYFALRMMPASLFRYLNLAFPIGVIAGALTTVLFPSPLGRFSGTYFLDAPMWAGAMLTMAFLSLCASNWRTQHSSLTSLRVAAFFLGVYCVFRTGERGTWVAIPVLLFIWASNSMPLKHRAIILILALLAAAAAYAAIPSIPARIALSIDEIHRMIGGDFSGSAGQRLQIWGAALEALRTHPLFGIGGEGVKPFFRNLGEHGWFTRDALRSALSQVHNEVIAHMMRLGAPGGLAILAIYLVPFALFLRGLRSRDASGRSASLMGTLFVIGYMIFGLSNETFNLKALASFYALTVSALLAFSHNVSLVAPLTSSQSSTSAKVL